MKAFDGVKHLDFCASIIQAMGFKNLVVQAAECGSASQRIKQLAQLHEEPGIDKATPRRRSRGLCSAMFIAFDTRLPGSLLASMFKEVG